MKIVFKALLGILNLIYGVMKLFPVKERITFISRQSNEKSEDMLLLERELRRQMPGTELVFLCRRIDGGIGSKIGYCFHILTQMKYIATSKVVVLDSYCISVSALRQRRSLVVIQMWHALGSLKKFGLSIVGEPPMTNTMLLLPRTVRLSAGSTIFKRHAAALAYQLSRRAEQSVDRNIKELRKQFQSLHIGHRFTVFPARHRLSCNKNFFCQFIL